MIIGAHETTKERGWSVHRNTGLFTVVGTLIFSFCIITTKGEILKSPAWFPMLDWAEGYVILGGWLMVSGILGLAGLSLERNDGKVYPRILTLISAFVGASFFATAVIGFTWAYFDDGYNNAGMFLAAPAALLHVNRIWLLGEKQFLSPTIMRQIHGGA